MPCTRRWPRLSGGATGQLSALKGLSIMRARLLRTLAAFIALAGAAGCGPQTPGPTTTVAAAFGMTDRAWIEITIAMDEQLRPLLALVPRVRRTRP